MLLHAWLERSSTGKQAPKIEHDHVRLPYGFSVVHASECMGFDSRKAYVDFDGIKSRSGLVRIIDISRWVACQKALLATQTSDSFSMRLLKYERLWEASQLSTLAYNGLGWETRMTSLTRRMTILLPRAATAVSDAQKGRFALDFNTRMLCYETTTETR